MEFPQLDEGLRTGLELAEHPEKPRNVVDTLLRRTLELYDTCDTGFDEHVAMLYAVVGLGRKNILPEWVVSKFNEASKYRDPPARLATALIHVYARAGAPARDLAAVAASIRSLSTVPQLPRMISFDTSITLMTALLSILGETSNTSVISSAQEYSFSADDRSAMTDIVTKLWGIIEDGVEAELKDANGGPRVVATLEMIAKHSSTWPEDRVEWVDTLIS